MGAEARRAFLRLRRGLPWLTVADIDLFTAYCCAYARWIQAEQALNHARTFTTRTGYRQQRPEVAIAKNYFQQMLAAGSALGLSPAARTRIQMEKSPDEEDGSDNQMFG
jgi:P27 family predicted phage terminase small subunit